MSEQTQISIDRLRDAWMIFRGMGRTWTDDPDDNDGKDFDVWLESVIDEAYGRGFQRQGGPLSYDAGYDAGVEDTKSRMKWDKKSERDFDCCKPTINSELVVGQEAYKRGYLDGWLGERGGAWDMGYQAGVKDAEYRVGETLKALRSENPDATPTLP